MKHPTKDLLYSYYLLDVTGDECSFVRLHLLECKACRDLYNSEVESRSVNRLDEAIFGYHHLTGEEIMFLADGTLKQPHMFRAVRHLSECRICRSKTPRLDASSIWARMPKYYLHYAKASVEEIIEKYFEKDPRPHHDEKISFREKLWRMFRYGENWFFENDWFDERLDKIHDYVSQVCRNKTVR